jgi:hypothetical protein
MSGMGRRQFVALLGGGSGVAARGTRAAGGEAADTRLLDSQFPVGFC